MSAFTPGELIDEEMRARPAWLSNRTGFSGVVTKMVGSRPSNSENVCWTSNVWLAIRLAVAASLTVRGPSMATVIACPPGANIR